MTNRPQPHCLTTHPIPPNWCSPTAKLQPTSGILCHSLLFCHFLSESVFCGYFVPSTKGLEMYVDKMENEAFLGCLHTIKVQSVSHSPHISLSPKCLHNNPSHGHLLLYLLLTAFTRWLPTASHHPVHVDLCHESLKHAQD